MDEISVDVHPGFPSRSEIQVDVHQASLEALAGTGVGSLFEALSWVFPLSTPGLGTIDIVGADVHPESYWHARASDPQWVRPVHLVIGVGERKAHFEVAVVPWLCDERATATSTDLPGNSVGGRRGLYFGRPLVPRLQLVHRPGLRRAASSRRLSWTLVPDIGSAVTFTGTARGLRIRFGRETPLAIERSELESLLRAGDPDRLDGGWTTSAVRRLVSLGRDGGSQSRRFSPAAVGAIDDELGLVDPTWQSRVLALADRALAEREMEPERLAEELSDESLQYRTYGDVVRRSIARGVLRGARAYLEVEPQLIERMEADGWNEASDPEVALLRHLRSRLGTRAQGEVDATLRPNATRGVVATADDRGTLATVETQRVITRYGVGGERNRGASRLWLRALHPDRRGEICPLLTPESEDLGFIRSMALGARERPRAGSTAASTNALKTI